RSCPRSPFVYTFVMYVVGAHRDLHSFPTRRSSDLAGARCYARSWRPGCSTNSSCTSCRCCSATACGCSTLASGPAPGQASGWTRSEEHTSELQSRFDLVCRLLLEKKKKKKKYTL